MKIQLALLVLVAGLAVAVALAWARIAALESKLAATQPPASERAFELAEPMAAWQRHADKLYFAGLHQHWALADFYLHEIEETAEDLAARKVVEDGVELTPLINEMLVPAVERLEESVKARDAAAFDLHYRALVDACNGCHHATKHGFIQITVPERSMFQNQRYLPPG
jgi:cytochrome c553